MKSIMIIGSLLLVGCSTIPVPDAQIRLSNIKGLVEGNANVLTSGAAGAAGGDSCILSVVGKVPTSFVWVLTQGPCSASSGNGIKP